jgi:hypothetical protein
MAIRIQLRRDTAANWASSNPVLRAGEVGIETDTLKFKIGNGSAAWNSITAYANVVPSDLNTTLSDYVLVTDIGDTVAGLNGSQNLLIPNDSIIFEGPTADSYELTLQATDPTADRTIILPDRNGTVITTGDTGTVTNAMLAGSIANDKLSNSSVTINGYTINLGSSATYGTDNISEGTTNLYFTNERAQDAVATALSNGTHTNITVSYDDNANSISLTGAQTYSDEMAQDAVAAALAAGTHTNITVSYNDNSNSISLTGAQTYSDENAQDAVGNAVGNGLDYDDITGSIYVDASEIALSDLNVPTKDVSLATYKITNLGTPTSANDAATKAYVDNTTAGINFHAPVHTATTANLAVIYDNGTNGVGATLTADTSRAWNTLDGHTSFNIGDRILVKNQSDATQNGVYTITQLTAPWILTRATDADNSPAGELAYGDFVFVQNGGQAGYGFIVNTTGTITIGSTNITYVQFNAGQVVVAGNGLQEAVAGTLSIDTSITADLSTAQTLTNKTLNLTSNTLSGTVAQFNTALSDGNFATLAGSETLTNKTLSSPTITAPGVATLTAVDPQESIALSFISSTVYGIGEQYLNSTIVNNLTAVNGWYVSAIDEFSMTELAPANTTVVSIVYNGPAAEYHITLSDTLGSNVALLQDVLLTFTEPAKTISSTEISYLDGVSSNIQTQLNAKAVYPSQTGNSGKYLTTNGSSTSWATVDALPSQTGNSGKYLTTDGTNASWAVLVVPIETGTATLTANTATTISTTALSGFTSIEYMVSLKQGSKVRTSKVIMQTDGTSVDMTEFAITETGGTMSGVAISATTASTNAVLQATVTDASSTNVDVKFSKVKL